jgi:hypothetical protein
MSIDEALAVIAGTRHCWVVWRADTGEPVSVTGFADYPTTAETVACLQSLTRDFAFPVKGRLLTSAEVTRRTLEVEIREAARKEARVAIFNQFANESTERLIEIVETDDYPAPMDRFHGRHFIVERLFWCRRNELSAAFRGRLRRVVESVLPTPAPVPPPFIRGGPEARPASAGRMLPRGGKVDAIDWEQRDRGGLRRLAYYLTVLEADTDRLIALWRSEHPVLQDTLILMECLGYLRVRDRSVIEDLIRIVEKPGFFEPRYRAMITLGQIGEAAGARAVEVIRAAIYDSSDQVTAARERVCERILSPDAAWTACSRCDHGVVSGVGHSGIPELQLCGVCPGLGFVRSADGSPL